MPTPEYTQQRIARDTKRKLKEISKLEGRSTPQQLKIIIDREYEAKPELNKEEEQHD